MKKFNDFHFVDYSPWPFSMSVILLNFVISFFLFSQKIFLNNFHLFIMLIVLLLTFFFWVRDIVRESTFQGFHSLKVKNSIKIGMILFIMSEVMFFSSFFWTFFHSSFNPALEIGNSWPPMGISSINPFHIPLLNTLILVSSGVTITYAHHSILNNNFHLSYKWLVMTILLGLYFSFLQFFEYKFSSFSIMDSIYGSIFFMATGFHGLHVLIGTLFIISQFFREMNFHFSSSHHIGFEMSCWYWHFVDVVWLFLYIFLYWWGY